MKTFARVVFLLDALACVGLVVWLFEALGRDDYLIAGLAGGALVLLALNAVLASKAHGGSFFP